MAETLEAKGVAIGKEELDALRVLSDDQLIEKSPEELLALSSRLGVAAEAAALPSEADDLRALEGRVATALRLRYENPGVYEGEEEKDKA